ncbi:M48 family metallopeptidase [bacterium]|nr:M48 family metallopeptidase [bacterium]
MNLYALIILLTLIIDYVVDIITDYLNIRSLNDELPKEFKGVYDAEKYKQSQQYTRVNTRFGLITSTFSLVITLLFWFSGGFNYLDGFVRSWELNELWNGLIYIGILIVLKTVIGLPFNIYSTFVIEEKFGFNKTTPKTFIADILKGIMLSILLGGPLLAGVLWFFESTGDWAWLYCWIGVTLFTLILQFIAPTWIMPLFNKFTPLQNVELRDAILQYAQSVKYPLSGIFVMDGSKRSSKSNAFFTGFGKNKRIALFDTLIEKHTTDELVAVVAHEIGHYKKKHIIQGMIIGFVQAGVVFYLLSFFLTHQGLFDAFFMEKPSVYAGLIFFGMLYAPIDMILSILMNIFSRKNEFEADAYAATTFGKPQALIDALKKLSVSNLSNLTPHRLNVFLNYSHPPVLERIEALKKI